MALKARAHESDLRSGGANRRQEPYTSHRVDVLPLVEPYRGNGKLSVRIENIPHKARFSAGARANEKSWSLTFDDLKNLDYLLPEGVEPQHDVTIRVIGLERGDTLGVLNVNTAELLVEDDTEETAPPPVAAQRRRTAESKTTDSIQYQLAATKHSLKSLEGQLAVALAENKRLSSAAPAGPAVDFEAERTRWKAEEASRLQEVNARWQSELQQVTAKQKSSSGDLTAAQAVWTEEEAGRLVALQRKWKAEEASRLQEMDARWQAELQQIAAKQNSASVDLSAAQAAWKEEEAGRLAALQRSWKAEEATRTHAEANRWHVQVRDLTAQRDAALANARTSDNPGETRVLRDTITSLQTTLVDRETALIQANKALDGEKLQRQQEADEYRRAQIEAQRLEHERQDELHQSQAQTDAQLKKHYAHEIARLTSRAETAEAALADQRHIVGEHFQHENELVVLRSALAATEAELQREHEKLVNTTDALRHTEKHEAEIKGTRPQRGGLKPPSFFRDLAVGVICTVVTILVLPEFRGWFSPAPVTVEASVAEALEAPVAQALLRTVSIVKTTRLRKGPAKSERSLLRAEKGVEVSLLEAGEIWSRVKMNYKTKSVEGWIENSSLDLASISKP